MAGQGAFDDFTRLRLKRAGLSTPDPGPPDGGGAAFVGRVLSTGPALGVGKFLRVRPTFVLGAEEEGRAGSLTPMDVPPVPVFLVGPGVPSTGDHLVCRRVDHRWVAERTVPGSGRLDIGTIPDCACTAIPASLRMTSADPACNYRMFQSCTIRFDEPPASLARLNLGSRAFVSTESFPDPIAGGAPFYYYLTCQFNQFSLTRVYARSPFGSPYRDGILYTWIVGGYGNPCDPFRLDNGRAYPGSDASCSVTIEPA